MTKMDKIEALHPAAYMHLQEVRDGKLSRREFLTRSTALGVSAVAAYGLLGLAAPVREKPENSLYRPSAPPFQGG